MTEVHINYRELTPDQRAELTEWVRSHNLEPKDISIQLSISHHDGVYRLHLTRFLRNERGKIRIDTARQEVFTKPVTIDLGAKPRWPGWLAVKVAS